MFMRYESGGRKRKTTTGVIYIYRKRGPGHSSIQFVSNLFQPFSVPIFAYANFAKWNRLLIVHYSGREDA